MLSFVQRRFAGGGWSPGDNHSFRQLTVKVKPGEGSDPMVALRRVRSFAKRHKIIAKTFQYSYYELPTDRRMREASERVYFTKFEYLSYCRRVINYSLKNNLLMRTSISDGDENRLLKLCPRVTSDTKSDGMSPAEIRSMADAFYSMDSSTNSYTSLCSSIAGTTLVTKLPLLSYSTTGCLV